MFLFFSTGLPRLVACLRHPDGAAADVLPHILNILSSETYECKVQKSTADILNGFDRMMEKVEAMPVTPAEKRRLIKEWLRSRLAGMENQNGQQTDRR
jgi:hypothetical protein